MNNSISLLITSCESFSDLWPNDEQLYLKYCNFEWDRYLLSDKANNSCPNLFHFIYSEKEYSGRLLDALKLIKTKFVFLTLDDYLPSNFASEIKFKSLISFMEENNVDYMRVYKTPNFGIREKNNKFIKKLTLKKSCYEVNLYPGIWNVKKLINLIKNENETPWQFEVMLTKRCQALDYSCYCCIDKKVFPFMDTIRKGKYIRSAYKFLRKNNLYISNRKIRTRRETFRLNFKTFVLNLAPTFIVRKYRNSKLNNSISGYKNNHE